jgi:hypothetical protein
MDTHSSLRNESDLYPDPVPRLFPCNRFDVEVALKARSIHLSGALSAECLALALHSRTGATITATISTHPRIVLTRGANDGLLIEPTNATERKGQINLCWNATDKARRGFSLHVRLVPNRQSALAVQSSSVSSRVERLSVDGTEVPMSYFGRCLASIPLGVSR